MLREVHVVPLAAESLGVRSMCTYVETPDIRILLDAGVSLCPNRFGLPPHPTEFSKIIECRNEIAHAAEKSDIIAISHYHYDHHTPWFQDWLVNWTDADITAQKIYQDKRILLKNPREHINYSQRERGWRFGKKAGRFAKRIENADGKGYTFGKTRLEFSEPVFHGPENSAMGWVLMTSITYRGEKFLFAPDVQGPTSDRALAIILKEKPQLLTIGGPPLYLASTKVSETELEKGLKNLGEIVQKIPHVILEHHILRKENWQERASQVIYETYKKGSIIQTAAEYLGTKNALLEANRKELYATNPPSKEFEKWMKSNEETKRNVKPPV